MLKIIQSEEISSNPVDRSNVLHLAEDKTAQTKLEHLEQQVTETDHRLQLQTALIIMRRFLKNKETANASTNTVNSALDAIKIELKQKEDEIVVLQKEAGVQSTFSKRLEFLLKQKVQ